MRYGRWARTQISLLALRNQASTESAQVSLFFSRNDLGYTLVEENVLQVLSLKDREFMNSGLSFSAQITDGNCLWL